MRLIPWLSLLYLLAFLDRKFSEYCTSVPSLRALTHQNRTPGSAIGNATLYGLKKDLKLTVQQYLITLAIFFISYAVFEVPSNVLLKVRRAEVGLHGLGC